MTLASTAITVYSTRAEFNAAFDRDAIACPCVACFRHPYVPVWYCAGCDRPQAPEVWRFYPTPDSDAHCPHCAEGVAL